MAKMLMLSATKGAIAASTSQQASLRTFFVDPAGDDGADGLSPATAWATVSKVNSASLVSGDTVRFKRGSLFRGAGIFPQVGGVTYGAYGTGAKPQITGAPDLGSPGIWTHASNGRWTTSVPRHGGQDPEIVWFDGIRRAPEANTAAVEAGSPSDWFWSGGTLHVQSGGAGINPASVWSDISVNQLEYGMYNNAGDWPDLIFEDLVFTHFRFGFLTDGPNNSCYRVEAHRCSRNNFDWRSSGGYLEECVSTDNGLTGTQGAHGYNFTLGATNCTMKNCIADNNREDNVQFNDTCGDNITIDGGSLTNPGENCIDRKAGTGHVIKNLTCSNNSDHPTINFHSTPPGVAGEAFLENLTVEHSSSNTALDVIEGNIVHSTNSFYRANASANQAVRVRSLTTAFAEFHSDFDIIWCRSNGEALNFDGNTSLFIDHATIVSNGGRGIQADQDGEAGADLRLQITNSIIMSGSGSFCLRLVTNIDHSGSDYCLLYRDQSGNRNYIGYLADDFGDMSDWGNYRESEIDDGTHFTERGVLEHVFTDDPLFVDRVNGDFSLQGGSPALTAASDGTHLGAWQQPLLNEMLDEGQSSTSETTQSCLRRTAIR